MGMYDGKDGRETWIPKNMAAHMGFSELDNGLFHYTLDGNDIYYDPIRMKIWNDPNKKIPMENKGDLRLYFHMLKDEHNF